ncbi:MAG: PIN domain-containing protein [Janthinobacterium lividum]
MQYVLLDTNAWINLSNGTAPSRLLLALHRGIIEEEITIILPTIIIDEWRRGKGKLLKGGALQVFDEIEKNIGTLLKNIDRNDSFIEDDSKEFSFEPENLINQWVYFKNIASQFKKGRRNFERNAVRNAELVEEIFNHNSTRLITAKDSANIKAGNFALQKKAPFGNKNSFADALILFSFLDYVEANYLYYTHFITYNTSDFCERHDDGKYRLHKDLEPEIRKYGVEFHQNVATALTEIYANIDYENVDFFGYLNEIKFYEEAARALEEEEEFIFRDALCVQCKHPIRFQLISLADKRTVASSEQMELDFVKNLPSAIPKKLFSRVNASICAYCDTEHFLCVNCDELILVSEDDYYRRIECPTERCKLPYYIVPSSKRWYGDSELALSEYFILTENKICKECNEVFPSEESNNDVCRQCTELRYHEEWTSS